MSNEKKHYVVCARPKVVLSGLATPEEMKEDSPTLTDVRMAVFWSRATVGPMGLAAKGPDSQCRITAACPTRTIPAARKGDAARSRVEGYGECSAEATKAWEREPWG